MTQKINHNMKAQGLKINDKQTESAVWEVLIVSILLSSL